MHAGDKTRKPKVVIDTNVFVSGLNFSGKPRGVLDLMRKGEIGVVVSPFILEELEKVLEENFGWSRKQVEDVIERIKARALEVNPDVEVSVIEAKENDNRILECALEGKAQFIVSGDKRHILPLKEFQGIKILSPADFLKTLSGQERR